MGLKNRECYAIDFSEVVKGDVNSLRLDSVLSLTLLYFFWSVIPACLSGRQACRESFHRDI